MIYIRCPSCATLIGNRHILLQQGLANINENSENKTKKELEGEKKKLINTLELNNYCCKMRIIGYISLPEIVK